MDASKSQFPVYDAAGAKAIDAQAIALLGGSGESLMRSAAAAAARVVRGRFAAAQRVVVATGSGNNGGDGYEVARLLQASGRSVRIVGVSARPASGDAATMLAGALAAGVALSERPDGLIADDLDDADLIVDALLGTGGTGAATGAVAEAITAICASDLPVVALDVPSGIDASTGELPGVAVRADVTVSFNAVKLGLLIAPGCEFAGDVIVVPIGIPEQVEVAPAAIAVADGRELLPGRGTGGSKYDAGALLVIGGSVGMAGAPALVAGAALRAGAGVVTVLVPEAIQPTVAGSLREAMVRPLASSRVDRQIADYAERARAVVLGPGLGREPGTDEVVRATLALDRPLIVDADALWWVAREPALLRQRTAPTVITPHAGEAANLLGVEAEWIAEHRLETVRALVETTGSVVLLKGRDTLVLSPEGRLGVRALGSAALATAGSGDVLAGIIGACLARGADSWTAAIAGAAAHVQSARTATAVRRGGAIIAGDLIEHLRVLGRPGSTL
jgi:ADP-dependent NAD(P)H-hydrate dehydratase / NAD(P)H-hydrate epimerase